MYIRDVSNGKRAPDGPGSDNANFLGEVRTLYIITQTHYYSTVVLTTPTVSESFVLCKRYMITQPWCLIK